MYLIFIFLTCFQTYLIMQNMVMRVLDSLVYILLIKSIFASTSRLFSEHIGKRIVKNYVSHKLKLCTIKKTHNIFNMYKSENYIHYSNFKSGILTYKGMYARHLMQPLSNNSIKKIICSFNKDGACGTQTFIIHIHKMVMQLF